MSDLTVPRVVIASVWIYQGLWCKLLGRAPHHQKIVETTPFLNRFAASWFLIALGVLECVLGLWAFSGIRAREAAVVQTVLLIIMNITALLRARNLLADPRRHVTSELRISSARVACYGAV